MQWQLSANARRSQKRSDTRIASAPLTGKLFDANGEPMSPTFSRGKMGKSYRYYVSASLQQGGSPTSASTVQRMSAPAIERVVKGAVSRWTARTDDSCNNIATVRLAERGGIIEMNTVDPIAIASRLADHEELVHSHKASCAVLLPLALPLRGGKGASTLGSQESRYLDQVLIGALRRAHAMVDWKQGLPTMDVGPSSRYDTNILRLAFLAPEIQRDILEGKQPHSLNLQTFKAIDLPLAWSEQRKALGYR